MDIKEEDMIDKIDDQVETDTSSNGGDKGN